MGHGRDGRQRHRDILQLAVGKGVFVFQCGAQRGWLSRELCHRLEAIDIDAVDVELVDSPLVHVVTSPFSLGDVEFPGAGCFCHTTPATAPSEPSETIRNRFSKCMFGAWSLF